MTRSHAGFPAQGLNDFPAYPMARRQGCPLDPSPDLGALRSEGPLTRVRLWDGSTPWLVTRYAEQRALLADRRVSADPSRDGYPHRTPGMRAQPGEGPSFLFMDDPEHARLRRMVTGAFTVRRIEAMRPGIQRIVDGLIAEMLAGPTPADLVTAFALPVPSLVICQLLGVSYADHDFFQRTSRTLINRYTTAETAQEAQGELLAYLDRLIERKLADPGDDLLSQVAAQRVATGEIVPTGTGRHGAAPARRRARDDCQHDRPRHLCPADPPGPACRGSRQRRPASWSVRTVEELLRYLTIVHSGRRRVAVEDINIADVVIRAGEGIILPSEIANRDATVFPDPDWLDVHRDARGHMAFGFGVHQCLGQPLARVELQVVYGTLYRRVPTLALAADPAQIPFKHDSIIYGVYELPVTW